MLRPPVPGAVEVDAPVADEPDEDAGAEGGLDAEAGDADVPSAQDEAGDPRDATEEPPLR